MLRAIIFCFTAIMVFYSCRSITTLPDDYKHHQGKERHMVAIFLDGTRDRLYDDDEDSLKRSHVQNTYLLLNNNINSLYVEGVGAGNRWIQAARAGTTAKRVMIAYRFLTENYNAGDSICLFGFSRGASQCRMLANIIYTIGIINLDSIRKEPVKQRLLLDIFDQYATAFAPAERKKRLGEFITGWNARHRGEGIVYNPADTTKIELMGLWDTVEALKLDKHEDPVPVPEHLNQLYNVKKLFHAVSLDDNRAFNYTPILATHKDVLLHPWQNINDIVDEVWFSGNHKNIGGGNYRASELNSITLGWMLSKVEPYKIFRNTQVTPTIQGEILDMRKGITKVTAFDDTIRGINKYWYAMNPDWNNHRIKVHHSVFERYASGLIPKFKMREGKPDWYDWEPFRSCFKKQGDTLIFLKDKCSCIEEVN